MAAIHQARRAAVAHEVTEAGADAVLVTSGTNVRYLTGLASSNAAVLIPAQGTSAATPLWAAVIALADQEAGRHLGFVDPALYAIARGSAYHRAFHDVVTGDNSVLWPTGVFTGYSAGPGWDPVTGWGSPDAQYLVPLLVSAAAEPSH